MTEREDTSLRQSVENADAEPRRRTCALVLGSGGARGYAHIGAVEVLEERGYDIVAIAGCSMGSLIGGVYAAGKMQDYKDWVTGLKQLDVLRLLDVSLSPAGAIRGEKVFSVVRDIIGDTLIEDLPMAYTAVATDLLAHKEIWFQEGSLHQAIRASIAIPGVVTPVVFNGRVLVDGGLLNPLPIIPTIAAHADYIFAVNLAGEDRSSYRLPKSVYMDDPESDLEVWLDRMRTKAGRWFDWDLLRSLGPKGATDPEPIAEAKEDLEEEAEGVQAGEDGHGTIAWDKLGIGKFDIMNMTIETMQNALIQYKIAGYPPDMLVNVPKASCRTYDYHKAPEMIQIGRERMESALDRFENDQNTSGIMAP
ncbi:patatin-like phospholipase family protein [Marinobacter bohaiensis]|uniref:patatin-like phospholipase family protein n=1 Tax=Marinobacter bohaiensis TaxID=2201898 RepID=UPI001955055F|nr:patatin-like phospholipase family protein [Marinobacter bohaiensis]